MIKPYIISYDLHSPGQKYEDLKKIIIGFNGASIKILESTWLVRTDLTPEEMVNKIRSVVDTNDSLFVSEITNNYQGLLNKDDWEFIKESIF
ncbi:hypothetical protein [Leuconostoc pseudomesenteroides]|uniref:hypothetical protein n=1 Tax=Leuconostoc pseudomesenteroides TaxID=33968 RepID=UPI0032E055DB